MVDDRTSERWSEVDGRRVFHRRLPGGPAAQAQRPLLLVHGISCCTGTWAPFVAELARRPDRPALLVPDLPAHGRSQAPAGALGIDEHAAWLLRFLDGLGVGAVDVMGQSMGGQVAIALAQRAPARIGRAVLLGSTVGARHASTPRIGAGLLVDSLREPPSYSLQIAAVFVRMGPLRYVRTVRLMQAHDAFAAAREVVAPTLVLQGARDVIIPMRVGRALARTLPSGSHDTIAGAPHAAQYSDPPRTADRVLAFLR